MRQQRSLPCPLQEFQLWTRRDCENTDNERLTRSWFYYGVSGQGQGDFIIMTIMNLNKQGRLYSQDYRPWFWTPSATEWQPIQCVGQTGQRDGIRQLHIVFPLPPIIGSSPLTPPTRMVPPVLPPSSKTGQLVNNNNNNRRLGTLAEHTSDHL